MQAGLAAHPHAAWGCWLEREGPSSQLREMAARFRLLDNSSPRWAQIELEAEDAHTTDLICQSGTSGHLPLWASGRLLQPKQCWHARRQAITVSWGPHSPHFSPKSGRCLCQQQLFLTSGSCWDQNRTWFFPLPLQAAVHRLKMFHNRDVLNKKGNILKILGEADFSIAQRTWL